MKASLVGAYTWAIFHDQTRTDIGGLVPSLILRGSSEAELRQIRTVTVYGQTIDFDFNAMLARYRGAHADPLYFWPEGDEVCCEVLIYHRGDDHRAVIETGGGRCEFALSPPLDRTPDAREAMFSELDMSDSRLFVRSRFPMEVVWQRVVGGQFFEEREEYAEGMHWLALPPGFADYYGVSLSCRLATGEDVEHKHVMYGFMELPTGRYLLDLQDDRTGCPVIAPRQQQNPRWKAAVTRWRGDLTLEQARDIWERSRRLLPGLVEIEVFIDREFDLPLGTLARNLRLTPADQRGPLAFRDSDHADFLMDLTNSLTHPSVQPWLKAGVSFAPTDLLHFGVQFAQPATSSSLSPDRERAAEIRHRSAVMAAGSSLICSDCAGRYACDWLRPNGGNIFRQRMNDELCLKLASG